jgi:hypothetical protein
LITPASCIAAATLIWPFLTRYAAAISFRFQAADIFRPILAAAITPPSYAAITPPPFALPFH